MPRRMSQTVKGVKGLRVSWDAPRGAIIHQHAVGQAIAPEGLRQVGLHRRALFIGTGVEAEGEAGASSSTVSGSAAVRPRGNGL